MITQGAVQCISLKANPKFLTNSRNLRLVCSVTVVYVLEYFIAIMEENIPIKEVEELSEFDGHTPRAHSAILSSTERCC